jgi:hypothetical protein
MTSVEDFEDFAEHEACEGEVVEGGEGLGEAFVVSGQAAESCGPGEASFDDPSTRQQDEAAFGLRVLDHLQVNAVPGGRAVSGLSGVALVDVGKFHVVSGDLLHRFGELLHLGAALLAGGGDMQGEQVAQGVHRSVHLGSFAPLGAIVSGPRTRLRRGLQHSAIHHHRRGLRLALGKLAQQRAQVLHHDLEASGTDPAPRLPVHHRPRRKIVRHHPPVRPSLH